MAPYLLLFMNREMDCTVPLKYKLHVTTHSYNGAFLCLTVDGGSAALYTKQENELVTMNCDIDGTCG